MILRTVGEEMTVRPRTIDCRRSLAEAREAMTEIDVHHLPVTDAGRLVGVVSMRDLDRLQVCKPNVDPEVLAVLEAMTPEPFTASPSAPLAPVVERMLRDRIGSAIVVAGQAIVGIFTERDAMRLLADLLESTTGLPSSPAGG